MEKPLLTIAIPAYNVANFLINTTEAFQNYNPSEIEVIIVNDGSTDNTKEIATNLASACPCIKIINQKNGGAGAAINTAIKNARGKYFRILDGDDWFDPIVFRKFFTKLKVENADLILTEHQEFFTKKQTTKLSTDYSNIAPNQKFNLENLKFKKYGPTLPNTTIKTSILKKSNRKLDDKCFYVDQEYNFICYVLANTVIKYDFPAYCYRLEQDNQSMAKTGLIKNVYSHEKVCLWLIKNLKNQTLPPEKNSQLKEHIIIPLCNLQYEIAIKLCHSRKAFLSFDHKLKSYPEFYNSTMVAGNIIKLHRKTKGITMLLDPILSKIGNFKRLK